MTRTFIAALITAFVFVTSPASAGGHNTPPPFDPSILDAELTAEIEEVVMGDERTQKYLDGRTPKKVIVVPGKIVNIVG